MQQMLLLHKFFKKELPSVHKTRLNCLMHVSSTASKNSKLYLTGLGRMDPSSTKTGSNIEKVNRLLGNAHLYKERTLFYKLMSSRLINRSINPWIHIDWSCINSKTKMYLLRASISVKGRAIVIYEECHHKEKDNNHATHKQFLNNLKEILPTYSIPIIITDAGFRAPWFKVIQQMGWHFVGRVRNKNVVLFDESDNWQYTSSFFKKAKPKPSYLGRALLTLRQQVEVHIVTYRGKSKNRHSCNINKQRRTSSKELHYSKAAKEPWVLVTSLPNSCKDPKHIVNIYRQRMRIEENFRDTKCNYYGLGLKVSLTRTQCRMEILLLVAAIATFAAWLSGVIVIDRNQASDYQAHSARFTRVLSTVYLGREAIKKGLQISVPDFYKSLKILLQMVINTQMEQGIYS